MEARQKTAFHWRGVFERSPSFAQVRAAPMSRNAEIRLHKFYGRTCDLHLPVTFGAYQAGVDRAVGCLSADMISADKVRNDGVVVHFEPIIDAPMSHNRYDQVSEAIFNAFQPPWALGLWTVFLILGSLQPHRVRAFSHGHHMHAVLHIALFGVLGSLAMLSTGRRHRVAAIFACIGLGLVIEIAQSLMYPNGIEWLDVRDDAAGVLVFAGLTIWAFAGRLRSSAKVD